MTREETFSAIWRSFLGDLYIDNGCYSIPPERCGRVFAKQFRESDAKFGLVQSDQSEESVFSLLFGIWYEMTKYLVICGRTLHHWVSDDTEDPSIASEADNQIWNSFYLRWWQYSRFKRFMTTKKGYVGMAPENVQRGGQDLHPPREQSSCYSPSSRRPLHTRWRVLHTWHHVRRSDEPSRQRRSGTRGLRHSLGVGSCPRQQTQNRQIASRPT